MASITLPLSRLTKGQLPPICASSGVPAANVFRIKLGSFTGAIPLNGAVARSLTRVQVACKIAFAAALGLFIAGLAVRNSVTLELASIPFVVGVGLMWAIRARTPSARLHGDEVVLERVHPGFVQACITPPGKCSTCPSSGECSVAEMDACSGHEHAVSGNVQG